MPVVVFFDQFCCTAEHFVDFTVFDRALLGAVDGGVWGGGFGVGEAARPGQVGVEGVDERLSRCVAVAGFAAGDQQQFDVVLPGLFAQSPQLLGVEVLGVVDDDQRASGLVALFASSGASRPTRMACIWSAG